MILIYIKISETYKNFNYNKMKKGEKKYKFKKVNTLSEFERRKLIKEKKNAELKLLDTQKYFGKIKLKKVISLRNMLSPLEKRKSTIPRKSTNNSIAFFPRKKKHFDTSKPVYATNNPNFLTTNFKNIVNSNILKEMSKVNKLSNKDGYKTTIRNNGMKSRKVLIYKQYNNGVGFDQHIMTNKSMPDIAYETKYTSDVKNFKTKDLNINEDQKNQTKYFNLFNNTSNKFKEKQSVLSTVEYSNIKKNKQRLPIKYKFSRENIIKSFSDINIKSYKVLDKNYLIYRKKYHFVKNTYLLDTDDYENLKKEVKKFNKNSLALLIKENGKLFSNIGSIVESKKFSQKFRDPLNNSFDKELKEERKKKEKNIIKLDILSGVDLLKDIDKELERKKIVKKVINVKSLWFKFKRMIIRKMVYLKHIQIGLNEILNNYRRIRTPFSYPQTEHLIMAIRNRKYDICCDILDRYKYIVQDFDYFHLTALHWAAKLNFFEIIPKLIAYGASVNQQNLWGDTPLHISATQNYYETSIFLLLYLASPFIKNNHKKKPFDCTNNIQFNIISKKIMDIHLRNIISRQKNYYESVQKEFSNFVIFEFSNLLNPVALSLIKDLKANYI